MSAKHTLGPWIVSDRNKTPLNVSTLATVAHCGDYQIGIETGRAGGDYRSGLIGDDAADAALIAAAPELLAACNAALPVLEAVQRIFESGASARGLVAGGPVDSMLRAAIAKAEGKS